MLSAASAAEVPTIVIMDADVNVKKEPTLAGVRYLLQQRFDDFVWLKVRVDGTDAPVRLFARMQADHDPSKQLNPDEIQFLNPPRDGGCATVAPGEEATIRFRIDGASRIKGVVARVSYRVQLYAPGIEAEPLPFLVQVFTKLPNKFTVPGSLGVAETNQAKSKDTAKGVFAKSEFSKEFWKPQIRASSSPREPVHMPASSSPRGPVHMLPSLASQKAPKKVNAKQTRVSEKSKSLKAKSRKLSPVVEQIAALTQSDPAVPKRRQTTAKQATAMEILRGPVTCHVLKVLGTRIVMFGDIHSEAAYESTEGKKRKVGVLITDYLRDTLAEKPNGVLLLEDYYFGARSGTGYKYDTTLFYRDPKKRFPVNNYINAIRSEFEHCIRDKIANFDDVSQGAHYVPEDCSLHPSNRVYACDFRDVEAGIAQHAVMLGKSMPEITKSLVRMLVAMRDSLSSPRITLVHEKIFTDFAGEMQKHPSNEFLLSVKTVKEMTQQVLVPRCRKLNDAETVRRVFDFVVFFMEHADAFPCNPFQTDWACEKETSNTDLDRAFIMDLIVHDIPTLLQYVLLLHSPPSYVLTYYGWLHNTFHAAFLQHMYGESALVYRGEQLQVPIAVKDLIY